MRLPATVHHPAGREDGVGLSEFAAILRRRWGVIALTTLVMLGLAMVFLAVTRPIYSASTQVFVDPRNRAAFQIEGTGSGAGYDPNLVDSQIVIIESETVLRRVIEQERLAEDVDFRKGDGTAQANALYNLREAVKVRRPDKTYVVEIEVRTHDAEKSARLANAVARAYLSDGRDSKSETGRREESWLERHLAALQKRLREAESRVEAFRVQKKIVGVGVDGRSTVEQRLSELNKGAVEAQRRVADARATLEQIEMLRRTGRLPDATSEAIRSTSIERLRAQLTETLRLEANSRSTLGPRHPAAIEIREQVREVRRQINEELARIAEAARNAYTTARNNEAAIEKQIDLLKRQTSITNQTLVELRDLERAVDAQKAVYTKFLNDKEQIARLMLDTPAGRIIAPAVVPTRKAFPNKGLILALAFGAGLLVGVALALAFETLGLARRGRSARSQTEASVENWSAPAEPMTSRQTAARTLHPLLRHLPRRKKGRAPTALRVDECRRDPASEFSRMVGSMALRVRAIPHSARQPATIMLIGATEEVDARGLAMNLAFMLHDAGEAVLLIEANPGASPLSVAVPQDVLRLSMPLFGRQQGVVPLPGGDREGPYLLVTEAVQGWHAAPATPARACTIALIEGPALTSPALATMTIQRRIDAVFVVTASGEAVATPLLPPALGHCLVGTVALAA